MTLNYQAAKVFHVLAGPGTMTLTYSAGISAFTFSFG
jgi:hypothetical protein